MNFWNWFKVDGKRFGMVATITIAWLLYFFVSDVAHPFTFALFVAMSLAVVIGITANWLNYKKWDSK